MTRHVAFLRAINVAGHARVEMSDVRKAFDRAGCRNVQTYIQSGNVIFDAAGDSARLVPGIRQRVGDLIGEEPEIVFRTARQIQSLVTAAPFEGRESDRTLKLYVVCLARRPAVNPSFPWQHDKERVEAIGMKGLDVLVVSRRKPSGFYGFPNAVVEQTLGVPATSRNWNTIVKVAALMNTKGGSSGPARVR